MLDKLSRYCVGHLPVDHKCQNGLQREISSIKEDALKIRTVVAIVSYTRVN